MSFREKKKKKNMCKRSICSLPASLLLASLLLAKKHVTDEMQKRLQCGDARIQEVQRNPHG
jgi:hypothetical protein